MPFTESPYAFERSSLLIFDERPYTVLDVREHKGNILATLEGVDSPEQAADLAGNLVKTFAENMPPKEEDEYYWFELIGMRVYTVDGLDLGKITHVIPTGANDVIGVTGDLGEVLLPMIDEVVIDVDTENALMVVDPLEGLIPDD